MAAPLALIALGVGTAAVAVVATSDSKPAAPDPLVLVPVAFPPAAEPPPPRAPVDEMKWHALDGGDMRIEAMAKSPRFPAKPPGDDRFVLATVVDLDGMRGKSFRVIVDAYVEDTTDAASFVELVRSIKKALASGQRDRPKVMPTLHHSGYAERLSRRFTLQHGMAIAMPGTLETALLPTQLPPTPAPPRFVGKNCNTIEKVSTDWQEVVEAWGLGDPRAFYGYDVDACGEAGPAYKERKDTKTRAKYRAQYNLRLEGEGSRVILTAEVARLPLVQLLTWRGFYGVR